MEVHQLLKKAIRESSTFRFHWKCKPLQLFQLSFDDLLLFCNGDMGSVALFHEQLQVFHSISGLKVNSGK